MRRGCSLTLFVIGGWILSIVGIVAMISGELGRISGGEFVAPWKIAAFFVAVALPFLLIGTWISPGRRIAELGLTLMIAAGFQLFMVLTLAAMAFDGVFDRFPSELGLNPDFTAPGTIVSLLATGGLGYLLWRSARAGK